MQRTAGHKQQVRVCGEAKEGESRFSFKVHIVTYAATLTATEQTFPKSQLRPKLQLYLTPMYSDQVAIVKQNFVEFLDKAACHILVVRDTRKNIFTEANHTGNDSDDELAK